MSRVGDNIPRFQSSHGVKTENEIDIAKLWKYLSDNYPQNTDINKPHHWPPADFDINIKRSC